MSAKLISFWSSSVNSASIAFFSILASLPNLLNLDAASLYSSTIKELS